MSPSIASKNPTADAASFIEENGAFDFVIVGGGTAGLVLAARLSEDPSVTVAVLEAGGHAPEDDRIDVPGMFGAGLMTEHDWKIMSEPGSGANEGVPVTYCPRGKVLGGSSALNFLVWDRCSRQELDGIEELGMKGWNWDTLYHYMKKSESFHMPLEQHLKELHFKPDPSDYGSDGPIQVSFPPYIGKQAQNWIPALESLGIPRNDHSLAGNNVGASVQPSIICPKTFKRSHSARAYLEPNLHRPNLKVLIHAHTSHIEFATPVSGEDLQATGVVFTSQGQKYTLPVKREMIITAGAYLSPAILERSGIGSQSALAAAGVKPLVDLPGVGENLQDHTYSSMAWELKPGNGMTLDTLRNDPEAAKEQRALYDAKSQTPGSLLTQTVPTVAYISLDELVGGDAARVDSLIKQAEEYVAACTAPHKPTLEKQLEWLRKYPEQIAQMELIGVDGYFATSGAPEPGKNYFTLLAAQQHLLSRGSVHISQGDALEEIPKVITGYYSAPWDLEVATAGTKFLRKIAATEQYSSYLEKEVVPGIQDQDLKEYTKTIGHTTEYHAIGSCSMLPREHGGVVDNDLLVYGLRNVRVCCASVLSVHISAHIQATVYGIAECAADIIKRDHGLGAFAGSATVASGKNRSKRGLGPQIPSK